MDKNETRPGGDWASSNAGTGENTSPVPIVNYTTSATSMSSLESVRSEIPATSAPRTLSPTSSPSLPPRPRPDRTEILRALSVLLTPGQVTEVRALAATTATYTMPVTLSGYFNDSDELATAVSGIRSARGIYIIPNPVNPDLLARAHNRLRRMSKGDAATADHDIISRRWLLIDIDPQRPADISANQEEHGLALARAVAIRAALTLEGWPEPILADSGNGAHLLYRIDLPTSDNGLVEAVLKALATRFDNDQVKVDRSVHNPARIWKLYGTPAGKGDHTPDRPHRLARLVDVPSFPASVPRALLEQLAATVIIRPANHHAWSRQQKQMPFNLEAWIAEHHLDVIGPEAWGTAGGKRWVFPVCPWNPDHTNGSAYIVQLPNGAISAGCHHNSCQDKGWRDLRAIYDPEPGKHPPPPRSSGPSGSAKSDLADRSPAQTESPGEQDDSLPEKIDGLPVISVTDRPTRDVTTDALQALLVANHTPSLFVRSGSLVRIRTDEHDRPIIDFVNEAILRSRLARVANFIRSTKHGWRHIAPPALIAADLLTLENWPLPPLAAITESPILRPDGTILDTPGYDPITHLFYKPASGLNMPRVPEFPGPAEVAAALTLIDEAIGEFPYVNEACKANTLALMLTPILRPAIKGCVPLALIDAPKAGTGKSLFAEVIALLTTGRPAAMMTAPEGEEEWRKRITSALLDGATVIIIDNVEQRLQSPSLAAVLTASTWTDRLLGQSQMLHLGQRATWIATGNNIRLGGDIPRRCYWIRLDAQMAEPWQRSNFKHPKLLEWVSDHRGQLLAALLTIARSWYAAGQPPAGQVRTLGSFESWSYIIASILTHAGISGFLDNLDELYQRTDDDSQQWEAFLTALATVFGDQSFTVADLTARLHETSTQENNHPLIEALPDPLSDALASDRDGKKGSLQKRIAKALAKHDQTRYGSDNIYLERLSNDTHAKVARWRVMRGFADSLQPTPKLICGSAESNTALPANTAASDLTMGQKAAASSPLLRQM